MDMTNRELETFESGFQGTLTIGTIATSTAILLTSSVQLFHQKFPNVRFEIQNMSTHKILESLKIGIIELGIIRTPLDSEDYDSFTLQKQPMAAAYTAYTAEFDDESKTIGFKELSGKPLLVNYRFESIITEACRVAGYEPNILCKVDDTRSILIWASLGMGIAVIPKDWLNIVPGLILSHREIDAPTLITSSAVVWLKSHPLFSVVRNFIGIFKDHDIDKSLSKEVYPANFS